MNKTVRFRPTKQQVLNSSMSNTIGKTSTIKNLKFKTFSGKAKPMVVSAAKQRMRAIHTCKNIQTCRTYLPVIILFGDIEGGCMGYCNIISGATRAAKRLQWSWTWQTILKQKNIVMMLQKEQKSGTCITSFNLTVNYSKLMTIIFFALIKQHDKWSYPLPLHF